MDEGELLVITLILAPTIASALFLLLRGRKGIAFCVALNAVLLIGASAALLAYMSWNGLSSIGLGSTTFYLMAEALLVLGSIFFVILLDNSTTRLTRDRMVSFTLTVGVCLAVINMILVLYIGPEVGW